MTDEAVEALAERRAQRMEGWEHFSANTREGILRGLRLEAEDDLDAVTPLLLVAELEWLDIAWVRRQEDIHGHCEGHALCDLVHGIEARIAELRGGGS